MKILQNLTVIVISTLFSKRRSEHAT